MAEPRPPGTGGAGAATQPAVPGAGALAASPGPTALQAEATVRAYHQRSKHRLQAYAAGPETLDWDAQPDPWRRYAGAATWALPLPADALDVGWDALARPGAVPPQPLDRRALGALLQLSLGLAAWKQLGPDRWALRCTPSSGNLHPTEAYLLCRGLPDLPDGLYHYQPREHALARRAALAPAAAGAGVAGPSYGPGGPGDPGGLDHSAASPGLWLGLSSIHWREAWKYGERAFRYCQLDLGHAQAALHWAAAVLGWTARRLPGLDAPRLAALLGLDRDADFGPAEREEPEALLWLGPPGAPTAAPPTAADLVGWAGTANRLDPRPMYHWPVIAQVARASRPLGVAAAAGAVAAAEAAAQAADEAGAADMAEGADTAGRLATAAAPHVSDAQRAEAAAGPTAARRAVDLIRGRRSAQRFDRQAVLPAAALPGLLAALGPLPRGLWPGRPRVHAVVFVHRVEGVLPGAYLLPRHADAADAWAAAAPASAPGPALAGSAQAAATPVRAVQAGPGLQPLGAHPALAGTLRTLCCHQALAADAALVVALVGEFDGALRAGGAPAYRSLLQEAGLLGHQLYLAAEAGGHQGTGIGCFFDDAVHELLGLQGTAFQALYLFTVGRALTDPRIVPSPPYAHLAAPPGGAPDGDPHHA